MLMRSILFVMLLLPASVYGQACAGARVVSSAQMSDEGQAAGALAAKPACERIHVPDLRDVFVARATSIVEHDGELNLDGECAKTLLQTVHLRVEERLIGDEPSELVVFAGDLNGFYFKTGKAYLVYAERLQDGTLHVSGYGQTKLRSEATDDLTYIRGFAGRRSGGEIFGHAWQAGDQYVSQRMVPWPVKPMRGLRVSVQGESQHEAIAGPDGKFRIGDLPPGKYTVGIKNKSAVWPAASQSVEVVDKGCVEVNFNVDPFHTQDGVLIKRKP